MNFADYLSADASANMDVTVNLDDRGLVKLVDVAKQVLEDDDMVCQ